MFLQRNHLTSERQGELGNIDKFIRDSHLMV